MVSACVSDIFQSLRGIFSNKFNVSVQIAVDEKNNAVLSFLFCIVYCAVCVVLLFSSPVTHKTRLFLVFVMFSEDEKLSVFALFSLFVDFAISIGDQFGE